MRGIKVGYMKKFVNKNKIDFTGQIKSAKGKHKQYVNNLMKCQKPKRKTKVIRIEINKFNYIKKISKLEDTVMSKKMDDIIDFYQYRYPISEK